MTDEVVLVFGDVLADDGDLANQAIPGFPAETLYRCSPEIRAPDGRAIFMQQAVDRTFLGLSQYLLRFAGLRADIRRLALQGEHIATPCQYQSPGFGDI